MGQAGTNSLWSAQVMKPSLNTCAFASIPIVSDSMVTITPIRVMVSMVWIHKIKSHDFTDLTSMDGKLPYRQVAQASIKQKYKRDEGT